MKSIEFVQKSLKLKPNETLQNRLQITFPFNGLCYISLDGSAPFKYELYCPGTGTHYSDKPILCKNKKKLLRFGSYKGRIFSFDFENASNMENSITLHARFVAHPFTEKDYSFREYTLDGLYRKTTIVIEAVREEEISLTNYRGGHYEVHKIYSILNKKLTCKIKYYNKIIESFPLDYEHSFKKPWIFHWPDSATLYIKNDSSSDLEILPTDIYFAGYLIKPTEVIERLAPTNVRNTFLIEGIILK